MTYVILPGRGAMIEYDNCHLSVMIIFEPYDHKSNNLIIKAHPTFDLPHQSSSAPTCTSLLHLGRRSAEVTMLTMEIAIRRTISTDLDLRKASHQEYSFFWYWGISFVCACYLQ